MSSTLENRARTTGDPPPSGGGDREGRRSPQRIALVTRRLWPLAGEQELSVLELAEQLRDRGALPTLVTARWQSNWAEASSLRGIPVVRLPLPATPGWRMLRYLYALARHLRQHRAEYDAVVVSELKAEAYCAQRYLAGSSTKLVLRAGEAGPHGDVAWQKQTRFGSRIAERCQLANAILASSNFVAEELRSAGYSADRIRICPPVIQGDPTPRTEENRQAARNALAAVNHDLHVVGGAPVALCIAPLQRQRGLEALVRGWLPIQQRWPQARLWIIGDGPEREPLFQLICNLDVRYRVVIPGAFDHWDDLFRAADLLVAPAPQPGSSLVLQHALASGVPVLASEQAEHRDFISTEQNGLLYSLTDRGMLSRCLQRLIESVDLRNQLGLRARDQHERQQAIPSRNDESLWLLNYLAAQRQVVG